MKLIPGILFVHSAFDLEQGNMGVLVMPSSLETGKSCPGVESEVFGFPFDHLLLNNLILGTHSSENNFKFYMVSCQNEKINTEYYSLAIIN